MSQIPLSNRQRKEIARQRTATPAAGEPKTRARRAAGQATREYDGLKLLAAKGKLTRRLLAAGHAYRHAYILASGDGVPLRSCLEIEVTGQGGGPRHGQPRVIVELEARQALAGYREGACGGVEELISALDRICGHGLTVWEAAGGKQLAAVALEAQLMTGLKLMAGWIERGLDQVDPGARPGMLGERGR